MEDWGTICSRQDKEIKDYKKNCEELEEKNRLLEINCKNAMAEFEKITDKESNIILYGKIINELKDILKDIPLGDMPKVPISKAQKLVGCCEHIVKVSKGICE